MKQELKVEFTHHISEVKSLISSGEFLKESKYLDRAELARQLDDVERRYQSGDISNSQVKEMLQSSVDKAIPIDYQNLSQSEIQERKKERDQAKADLLNKLSNYFEKSEKLEVKESIHQQELNNLNEAIKSKENEVSNLQEVRSELDSLRQKIDKNISLSESASDIISLRKSASDINVLGENKYDVSNTGNILNALHNARDAFKRDQEHYNARKKSDVLQFEFLKQNDIEEKKESIKQDTLPPPSEPVKEVKKQDALQEPTKNDDILEKSKNIIDSKLDELRVKDDKVDEDLSQLNEMKYDRKDTQEMKESMIEAARPKGRRR